MMFLFLCLTDFTWCDKLWVHECYTQRFYIVIIMLMTIANMVFTYYSQACSKYRY